MPLQKLDLRSCPRLEDDGIAQLAALPIRELKIGLCEHLSDLTLLHLRRMPLQYLTATGPNLMTVEGFEEAGLTRFL